MVLPSPSEPFRDHAPTEATHLTNEPSLSLPSAANTPAKGKAKTEDKHARASDQKQTVVAILNDETGIPSHDGKPFTLRWTDEEVYFHFISISRVIVERLRGSYAYCSDSFAAYLRNYLKRKYLTAHMGRFPFTLLPSFFVLCKDVMGITHELFSGALRYSAILPHYCSEDSEDVVFGSKGTWGSNEDAVTGGVGDLPFQEEFITDVIFKLLQKKLMGGKAYCRIFLFPVENEETLLLLKEDEDFFGEVVCMIPGKYVHLLRHNLDFFRGQCGKEEVDEDWRPPNQVAIVIWVSEHYRVSRPPPQDVEECFAYWAADTFGDSSIIDFDALYRAFPPRTRRLVYKEQDLQEFEC